MVLLIQNQCGSPDPEPEPHVLSKVQVFVSDGLRDETSSVQMTINEKH